jgi:transcriptional regulator with XRE-family HTH domain
MDENIAMKTRGRPPKNTGPPRYVSRLRELRQRLGLSQQEVAVQAGISAAYYGALERGDKRINADTAQRLHAPLRCGVSDLLAGTRGVSVPLRFAIAAAEADGRPDDFDLPEPHEMLQLGRMQKPEDCLAAEIFDDSADLDFPRGTVLFFRPLAGLHEPLRAGVRVVARFLLDGQGERRTHEILYGILDQNILGDLVLITRTRNRRIPRHALIQASVLPRSDLAEAGRSEFSHNHVINYQRGPDDPAEILGLVVYAMGPIGVNAE